MSEFAADWDLVKYVSKFGVLGVMVRTWFTLAKRGNGCLVLGLCVRYGMMVFMERDSTRVNENLALKGN